MPARNGTQQRRGIVRFLIRFVQIVLYIPIQITYVPFAVIGLLIAIDKEMRRSKKLGISFSAIQALQYRWIMHYFNTRPNPLSVAFIKIFPSHVNHILVYGRSLAR